MYRSVPLVPMQGTFVLNIIIEILYVVRVNVGTIPTTCQTAKKRAAALRSLRADAASEQASPLVDRSHFGVFVAYVEIHQVYLVWDQCRLNPVPSER